MCLAAILWARIDSVTYGCSAQDAAAAGFDDLKFYEEIANPPNRRSLPMQQNMAEQARRVFELWLAKSDRRLY